MIETPQLVLVATVFLLGGTIKGMTGLGLVTISLGLLAATLDLTTAMALLIFPALSTNIWQSLVGKNCTALFKRIWMFLFFASMTIWFGSIVLVSANPSTLLILLGSLIIVYSSLDLFGIRLSISPQNEKLAGPIFGIANGILAGMTGSFVVPGVMYLQAIGLSRDQLVQAMGMLFTLSTISLAFALNKNNFLTAELTMTSAFAVIPSMIGLIIGQQIRKSLSKTRFRKIFLVSIFILGVVIILNSVIYLSG
jgi:uncharacterized membrane protein YfcA